MKLINHQEKDMNTKMMKVQSKDLNTKALDWAVALAKGYKPFFEDITSLVIYSIKQGGRDPIVTIKNGEVIIIDNEKKIKNGIYSPSTDESRLVKVKSRFQIETKFKDGDWIAVSHGDKKAKIKTVLEATGKSKTESVAKVFVMAVLGSEVEIPEELMNYEREVKNERIQKVQALKETIELYTAESLLEKIEKFEYQGVNLIDFLNSHLHEEEKV